MKVLFVQKMAGISGSELYFLKILPALKERGVECEFLCVYNKGNAEKNKSFIEMLNADGIKVTEIEITSVLSLGLLSRIYKIYKEGKFDILHTHLIHADFWGAMVRKIFDKKVVLVSTKHGYDEAYQAQHGFDPKFKKNDLFYKVAKIAEKQVLRSASISNGLRHLLVEIGIAKPERIEVIQYGFDFSSVKHDTSGREYRYSPHQLVIIGRLIPVKGHHFVFEIMPQLIQEFPDICLVIVGTGTIEAELKEQVKARGIEKNVRFEGFQRNIHDYLKHSDIAVIPSTAEGFCAVILEAWHNHTPVITFDVPAPNEIIKHDKTGYLIKPFDTEELRQRISHLLNHPEERKRLGDAGYESLQKEFSLKGMVDATLNMYQKALNDVK